MSGPATVLPDLTQPAGYALIRVPGAAATGLADPRFRLTRDGYEAGTLGAAGWQVADTLLSPLSAKADGDDLVFAIGPPIVDHVESGVVVLAVPSAGYSEPLFWPDLPLSRGGQGAAAIAIQTEPGLPKPPLVQSDLPKVVEQPKVVEPPKMVDPPPKVVDPPKIVVPPPKPTPRSPIPYMLAGVVLLAGAGAGTWYYLHRPGPPPPPPIPDTDSHPPIAAHDCDHGTIAETVACAADPDGLYAVAQRRWDGGQTDQGFELMQIAADRGSGPAALKLAQLYDPNGFRPGGPIPQANPRQSALYYRKAAQAHQDAANGPRDALRQKLRHDADDGDTLAGLTIKDYWP